MGWAWPGLAWAGLSWAGLGQAGLGWAGLGHLIPCKKGWTYIAKRYEFVEKGRNSLEMVEVD